MLFEVISETFEYRPRRCTLVVYTRGQRGCLPDSVVLAARDRGEVRIIGDGGHIGKD